MTATATVQTSLSSGPARRGTFYDSPAEDLLVVVAPGNGRFEPVVSAGAVAAGAVVARLSTRNGCTDVVAPTAAVIRGLLTLPGHLVRSGQALVWGHAAGGAGVT